jgi:hypothetical protein
MKKFVQILEDYVQWLALLLGVGWVAYIVMTYIINVPFVTIPPDTTPLTAGKVDDYIDLNFREKLDNAIVSSEPVKWPTPTPPIGIVDIFRERKPAGDETEVYVPAPTQDLLQNTGPVAGRGQLQPVKAIATLPPIILDAPHVGISNVTIPSLPVPNVDVDWVAISGLIPMKPIAQEWTAKYVNTLLPSQSTYILQVTLYRQQWNPTKHDWDPETSDLMKPGQQPVQPLPAYPQANVAQENDYLGSIQTMAGAITNPMFYHVNKGDPWPWPANVAAGQNGAAPAAPAAPTGPGAATQPAVPAGAFLPPAVTADIPVVLHDESVQSNQTYRYRIGYRLYNPAFGEPAAFVAPNTATQFALDEVKSDWTKEIYIEPRTHLYLKDVKLVGGTVTAIFDVFTWTNGVQRRETDQVQIGDEIGKGDFATRNTLIDVSNSNRTALVADDVNGSVTTHDAGVDTHDLKYLQLQKQAVNAAPPAGAGN